MAGLPPPPIQNKPGSFTWLEWYRQLRNYVSTSGSVPWYIINFSGSNLTDTAIRLHNNLQGLQGGAMVSSLWNRTLVSRARTRIRRCEGFVGICEVSSQY